MKIISRLFPAVWHSFIYLNARIKKHKKFIFPHRRGIKEVKKLSNKIKCEGLTNLRVHLYVFSGCIANLCQTEYLWYFVTYLLHRKHLQIKYYVHRS